MFPLRSEHNHAPGVAECPNGDLLVSWYRGSGERQADDVAVYGARLRKGATEWTDAFLLVDNPGFPDGNTALPLLLYIPTCTKEAAATKSKYEAYERDLLWEDSVLDLAANVRASFILRPCLPLPRPCLTLLPACTLANAGRRRAPSAVYATVDSGTVLLLRRTVWTPPFRAGARSSVPSTSLSHIWSVGFGCWPSSRRVSARAARRSHWHTAW